MIYCRDLGFCYLPQKSIGFYFTWPLNYWWLIFILWRHGFRLLLGGSILVLHPLDVRPWMCSLLLMCDSSGVSTGRLRGYQAPPIWWSLNSKLCFPSIDQLLKSLLSSFSLPDFFFFPAGLHICSSGVSQRFEESLYSDFWAPSQSLYLFWDFSRQFPATLGMPNPNLWFLSTIRLLLSS